MRKKRTVLSYWSDTVKKILCAPEIPLTFYHDNNTSLTPQWKFAQLAGHVWKRLQKEYYPTLLPKNKWTAKTIDL